MHTIEDIRELRRMHGRRGQILPSEKLNQLSERGQPECKRTEITIPTHTPYIPHIGVSMIDVPEVGIGHEYSLTSEQFSHPRHYPPRPPLEFRPHPIRVYMM